MRVLRIIICLIVLLVFRQGVLIADEEAGGEPIMLYRNFYYEDLASEVYAKIIEDPDLREEPRGMSYQEWLDTEKYDGAGVLKIPTLNEYYYIKARRIMLDKLFICRFRIDKEQLKLLRIFLTGPQYTMENDTKGEIEAFIKIFTSRYDEPTWKDIDEGEFEVLSLANTYDYTWQTIWEIPDRQGVKEIKIGVVKREDNAKNIFFSSVISLEYIKKPVDRIEKEDIKEEDLEQIIEDF